MRDHPLHGWEVLAGMWGVKLTPDPDESIYSDQYLIRDHIW